MADNVIDTTSEKKETLFFSEKTGKNLSIGGIVFLLLAIIAFTAFGDWSFSWQLNEEKIGQFGDFIGGIIGTVFSLVGIILFYVALKEQRKDIKINQTSARVQTNALEKQIEEFELQRDELKETRKIVKQQSETLKFQRFESTFFNLLSLHHQIVAGIDEIQERSTTRRTRERFYRSSDSSNTIEHIIITGRDVFKQTYQRYMERIHRSADPTSYLKIYASEYEKVQTDFGHYFRNLYRIIKFIDGTVFTDTSYENYQIQYQYTSMVRAQLSDYELLWLFYNCLSNNGEEKFKPLIEKYCILKNTPKDKIHDQTTLSLYAENAFEKQVHN